MTGEMAPGRAPGRASGMHLSPRQPGVASPVTSPRAHGSFPDKGGVGRSLRRSDENLRVDAPGGDRDLKPPKGQVDLPRDAETKLEGSAYNHTDSTPWEMEGAWSRKTLHMPSPVLVQSQALKGQVVSKDDDRKMKALTSVGLRMATL